MSNENQTFDELHSLVLHQLAIQDWYLTWEKKDAFWHIFFMGILIFVPLWIFSWDFLLTLFFIWPIFGLLLIANLFWFESEKIKYYKWIQELYRLSKWTQKRVEDFNEILMLLKKLKKILNKKWNKFVWLWLIESEIRANQYKYFSLLLDNLNSDLVKKIEDMGKTLESAKSEVESTIKWTTELAQISKLQRSRLDRQIEQFEKLQKVLVKM
jgi:hypothetical protein